MSWQGKNGVKRRRLAYINLFFSSSVRIFSPFKIPHSFGKALNTCSPQKQPPLMSLLPTSICILTNLQFETPITILVCSNSLLFLYSPLLQSPKFLHHYWLLLSMFIGHTTKEMIVLSLYWDLLQIHVIVSTRDFAWCLILRPSPRLTLSESSETLNNYKRFTSRTGIY